MSNESVFLPAAVRDRIWDLLKERKVTQAELATRIGCSESSLSRFISGKTDKLGDENIIRIARAFEVSTDFLLGEVDEPDRKNYDISELGLSVEAARNLYTQKVNPKIVSYAACQLCEPHIRHCGAENHGRRAQGGIHADLRGVGSRGKGAVSPSKAPTPSRAL